MESYEEIFILIKKWFDLSLNISINIPDDLDDGHYYLELMKKCTDLDISTTKNKNYEKIECVLNEFYGFQTNCVVDYFEFLYSPSNENIINLCIFCIVFCEKYKHIPCQLTEDDLKRLFILTKPVYYCLKRKVPPSPESFRAAIEKAKDKELEEISLSSSSINRITKTNTDNSKKTSFQPGSDDDISISSNMPSLVSEISIHPKFVHDSNNDFVSDVGSHDQNRLMGRRYHRNTLGNKLRRNQNLFLSPVYRRSVNSPKLNESRKLDQRLIKKLDFENQDLKQTISQYSEEIDKLIESEKKFNSESGKLKIENRKLMDNIDCLNSKLEESSLISLRKDKEFEKMRKDLELNKKQIGEKSDEIKQLEHSNHKLRQDIHDLNYRLKNKSSQCEESMKLESDITIEKRILEDENLKLKEDVVELQNQIMDLQNSKRHVVGQDISVESPISSIEIGESLDIINQVKLAEMREELERKTMMLEKEIETFKRKIDAEKKINEELFKSEQEISSKYRDVLGTLENCQKKLLINEEELNQLREGNIDPQHEKRNFQTQTNEHYDETQSENIKEKLKHLFSEKQFSDEEKFELFNLIGNLLNIDIYRFQRNHDLCQKEITHMYQKLKHCRENIGDKETQIRDMYNIMEENQQQFQTIKQELTESQLEKENIIRSWQNSKSKSDETEFKLKKTLLAVAEEKQEVCQENHNLKKDLLTREKELQKSIQEFNNIRGRYDQCLESLDKMSKDCNDYEQVIIGVISENINKICKNKYCQTDYDMASHNFQSVNYIERGIDYRKYCDRDFQMPSNVYIKDFIHKKVIDESVHDTIIHHNPYKQNSKNDTSRIAANFSYEKSGPSRPLKSSNDQKIFSYPINNNRNWDHKCTNVNESTIFNFSDINKKELEEKKIESPAVKPSRLHQMISRNLQQPEHLKSSYPVETQAVAQDYLAHCLIKEIKLEDSDLIALDRPEITPRSSARYYTQIDNLNLRPNINSQGVIKYENSFSDELIKASNNNGLTSRNMVLSARSNNTNSLRNDEFIKPLNPSHSRPNLPNRDSDRENVLPFCDSKSVANDEKSIASTSVKFEIVNTPKKKTKRNHKINEIK